VNPAVLGCFKPKVVSESYTGPLDIVPGAVVAFDQYAPSAAYLSGTPNYARLIRDSDSAEMQFTFGEDGAAPTAEIVAWLDGATGSCLIWNDGSGNANDAADDITGSLPPAWSAETANGLPGFTFDGGMGLLTGANLSLPSNAVTIIVVSKVVSGGSLTGINEGSNENSLAFDTVSAGGGRSLRAKWTDAVDPPDEDSFTGTQNISATLGNYFIAVARVSSAAAEIRVNGASIVGAEALNRLDGAWSQKMAIGDANTSQSSPITGDILATYIYPSSLSTSDAQTLEQHFATRYGITLP
jgi:hypothetical protein